MKYLITALLLALLTGCGENNKDFHLNVVLTDNYRYPECWSYQQRESKYYVIVFTGDNWKTSEYLTINYYGYTIPRIFKEKQFAIWKAKSLNTYIKCKEENEENRNIQIRNDNDLIEYYINSPDSLIKEIY